MARIVMARSSKDVEIPSGHSIAVFSQDEAKVYRVDDGGAHIGTVSKGQQTFGPYPSGATLKIEAIDHTVFYAVGQSPVMTELMESKIQRSPFAMNASAAIPAGAMAGGLITSNSVLGATGTLPTGAAMDDISDFRVDDSFEWSAIALGLGAFTVSASAGHNIVGSGVVGSGSSGLFITRKIGQDAFTTYRIG